MCLLNLFLKKIVLLLLLPFAALAQQVEVVKFSYLDSLMKNNSDTTYVINFWATWCRPCVQELPSFEALTAKAINKKVKVILVSMDFKSQLNLRLIPFVKEKRLKSRVVLLNEPDYNSWIDKVDKSWSGGIPATLVINNSTKQHEFYEKEFTDEELDKVLNP